MKFTDKVLCDIIQLEIKYLSPNNRSKVILSRSQ